MSTGWRSSGGVSIVLISRMPVSAISSVRGIGVAVIVSTSTLARNCFSRSLWATPNRCSSSTTSRPRSLNAMSLPSSRCVPITTSTLPSLAACTVSACWAGLTNRLSILTVTGKGANRSLKVMKCCSASRVVGTSTATCLPSITALKAARTAISVLPKPTSPQISRSMGLASSMSAFTSSIAVTWSEVSSWGNASSSSRCQGVSGPNAWPGTDMRTV